MFQVTFPSSDSVILQYSPIPDEYLAKTKPLIRELWSAMIQYLFFLFIIAPYCFQDVQ